MAQSGGVTCGRLTGAVLPAYALAIVVVVMAASSASASGSAPNLVLSPSTDFHDGESISISVGANNYFTPNSRVNILECADPGGSVANLPKSISTCDGNTIQGNTVLVAANGSFSDADYTLYMLPSSVLGEQSNDQPVCNESNPCVLYVGQNQNDFTVPKVFSAPFSIEASSGSTTSSTATATTTLAGSTTTVTATPSSTAPPSSTSTSVTSAVDPSVSVDAGAASDASTLPNTGLPVGTLWLAAIGVALVATGAVGRKIAVGIRR